MGTTSLFGCLGAAMSNDDAPEDAIAIASIVAAAIERAGGRYFIGGSLASSMQGEPRSTNDIDIVVDVPIGKCRALIDALGSDFEADIDDLRRAIVNGGSTNMFYLPLVTKIDIFGLGSSPFDESEFERRRELVVRRSGERLWFKSPEDTILRKLLWFREGGCVSTKQWRDVVQVLRVSRSSLDRGYLDSWAARLGITDLLTSATREADV